MAEGYGCGNGRRNGGQQWIDSCVMHGMESPQPASIHKFSYIGLQYYSLTWCCCDYQHLFTQRERVDFVRAQFLRASVETNVVNIAYCFMSDHVHQLVKGDACDADAKAFINRAKQYSGFYFKAEFGMRLWSRKGFNRVLLQDQDPRAAAQYIIENPVRACLATRVDDYPYVGSERYTLEQLKQWAYSL